MKARAIIRLNQENRVNRVAASPEAQTELWPIQLMKNPQWKSEHRTTLLPRMT